jgi:hypothetical protein
MRIQPVLPFLASLFCANLAVGASDIPTELPKSACGIKIENIEKELARAQQQKNNSRIQGLEKALSETRTNCTDDDLEASRQKKLKEKREKIEERENDLLEKVEEGDPDGIAKAQRKLGEAQQELLKVEQAQTGI